MFVSSTLLGHHADCRSDVTHHSNNRVACNPRNPFQRANPGQQAGEVDDRLADWVPLLVVAVQECVARVALDDHREFPAQVESVLHAGVHALSTGRAVNVRRVTGEKHSSPPVCGDLTVVNFEAGQPVWRRNRDAADPLVDDLLQLFLRGVEVQRHTRCVVDLCQESNPPTAHRQRDDWAVGGEVRVHVRVVEMWLYFDVAEDETLTLKRTLQLCPDQVAHAAVAAVGADHPWRVDTLGCSVYT